MLAARTSVAQPAGPADGTSSSDRKSQPAAPADLSGDAPQVDDYILLIGPDGKPVVLRTDATVKNFLQSLKDTSGSADSEAAPYNISSIAIEGVIDTDVGNDDDLARLQVAVEVYVNAVDETVRVPLDLREAILADMDYSGNGQARPDSQNQNEAGHSWLFRGRGKHTLRLSLLVKIRKLVGARRLQLSLPSSAVSSLTLRIPQQGLKVNSPGDAILTSKDLAEGATEIQLYGFGQRLDLHWQPLPDRKTVETVLQTETSVEVEVMKESVFIQARQGFRATQGSFEELTVKLPEGFKIGGVKGRLYSNHRDDPNAPNWVIVQLEEETDEAELEWTLEKEGGGNELTLDGFDVGDARHQTGEITITTASGYRIEKIDSDVLRSSVYSSDERASVIAYRFFRQPFRLVLKVEEIAPWYTVEPHMFLRLSQDAAELQADYHFEVMADRGVVRQVELDWPALDTEGWKILPSDFVEAAATIDRSLGRIRYELARPKSGRFQISLRARRQIPSAEDASIALSLPVAAATRTFPTLLAVAENDNIEAALSPGAQTEMRPLSVQQKPKLALPELWRDLREPAMHEITGSHQFFAAVATHERTVRTNAAVAVQMQEKGFLVTQRTSYDVEYGRLSEVRLQVPESLADRMQFFFSSPAASEVALVAGEPFRIGNLQEMRFALPEPKTGHFDVLSRYILELPEEIALGGQLAAAVPVVASAESELSSVRLSFVGPDRIEAEAVGDEWQRQLTSQGAEEWISSSAVGQIPLTLSYPVRSISQSFSVPKALIQTWVDDSGTVKSRSQFRIDGSLDTIEIVLPAGLRADGLWWNDRSLDVKNDLSPLAQPGTFAVSVPGDTAQGSHLLTVDAHSQSRPSSWSTVHQFAAPRLGAETWINQTVWQVMLPIDQHLLLSPEAYTRLFQWRRRSILWGRAALPQYANLGSWISDDVGPESPFDQVQANAYVFGRIGAPEPLGIRSMQLSIIVLFGAGIAWVLGVILLRVPVARQPLSLLTMLLCLSILSLRFAAPLQLLVQPAALGAVLAVVAVLIDRYFRRTKPATILSVSSPGEFAGNPASTSSEERILAISIDQEPASTRSSAPQVEPVSSSDTGSL